MSGEEGGGAGRCGATAPVLVHSSVRPLPSTPRQPNLSSALASPEKHQQQRLHCSSQDGPDSAVFRPTSFFFARTIYHSLVWSLFSAQLAPSPLPLIIPSILQSPRYEHDANSDVAAASTRSCLSAEAGACAALSSLQSSSLTRLLGYSTLRYDTPAQNCPFHPLTPTQWPPQTRCPPGASCRRTVTASARTLSSKRPLPRTRSASHASPAPLPRMVSPPTSFSTLARTS